MPRYIVLMNFTDQGVRNIQAHPQRREQARQQMKAAGITFQGYLTMGAYDYVVVMEAPNDEAVAQAILAVASQGNIRTQTLRAFDESETDKIIAGLGGAAPRPGRAQAVRSRTRRARQPGG